MYSHFQLSSRGFSIIMALGTIGIILILVVSLVTLFQRELQLTRIQYDTILSYAQAEGAFEYARLKLKNHKDGFADSMASGDIDSRIFSGATYRTQNVKVSYRIENNSTSYSYTTSGDSYEVFPLFIGTCQGKIGSSVSSCDPRIYAGADSVGTITLTSTNPSDIAWSIVAQSGSQNVSISGTGNITGTSRATMRIQSDQCISSSGAPISCSNPGAIETLTYFYEKIGTVDEFLQKRNNFAGMAVDFPYLLIQSSGAPATITLSSDKPFTLPNMTIQAEGQKGNSLQSIQFSEDKSRYYEALKYGIYNTAP